MKVAHLTSVHPAFDNRIFEKECKSLAAAGFDVVLVAPGDKDTEIDGVSIRSVKKQSSRILRMILTAWSVYATGRAEDAAIYHFHDPELIPIGILLRLQGKIVIFDVHEDIPEDIKTKEWIPKVIRLPIGGAIAFLLKVTSTIFSAIISATPSIARRFPKSKTIVVYNYPLRGELVPPTSLSFTSRPNRIAYVGSITRIRGICEIVKAMESSSLPRDTRLVLAGHFHDPSLLEELKTQEGWKRVDFVGWKRRGEVRDLLASSKVGLVLFQPGPNHDESLPNKLFEYMSAGLPLVASSFPLWREIIERNRCGLLVNPQDPPAISAAITYLLTHPDELDTMGQRGLRAVQDLYNWDNEASKLIGLYRKLAAARIP